MTKASSINDPSPGFNKHLNEAWRADGSDPAIASAAAKADGPLVLTTAIAAGGRPDDSATMVSSLKPLIERV